MSESRSSTTIHKASAAKVWPVMSDFSWKWITPANSPASIGEVSGEGVGATRQVLMGPTDKWGEECTVCDANSMTMAYKILTPIPGPFAVCDHTTFTCTLSCKDVDGGCEITIASVFDAVAGGDLSTLPPINEMYGGWAKSIVEYATQETRTSTTKHDISASKVWPVLSDFNWKWITPENSPASIGEVSGEGVGATRQVLMGPDKWGEECTVCDANSMTMAYKILTPFPGPFAVCDHTTFTCTLSCKDVDGGCEITIDSVFQMVEGGDVSALPPINEMYGGWAKSIAEYASKQ